MFTQCLYTFRLVKIPASEFIYRYPEAFLYLIYARIKYTQIIIADYLIGLKLLYLISELIRISQLGEEKLTR